MQKQVSTITGIVIIVAAAAIAFGGIVYFLKLQTTNPEPQINPSVQNSNTKIIDRSCIDTAKSTADINVCASNLYKAADLRLNTLYQKITAKIDVNSLNQFIIADQSWIKNRDETCKIVAVVYEGGSIVPSAESFCLESLTNDRIKELSDILYTVLND